VSARRALVGGALLGLAAIAAPAAAQPAGAASAGGWRDLPAEALRDSARARLARLDGTVAVAGLDSAVEVRRDRWGVPHIYARTQHDLFLAQGYVAAQDRLFQMELWRRAGEGRLAEVLGPAHVDRDRFARLFRYRGDMAAEWASYAPDAREIVAAFVDGVNAYIAEVRDRPPIEFALLGFAPEPWTPEVPLNRMAGLAMTDNARREVLRAQLVRLLGRERAEAVWPTDPYRRLDPAPGLDLAGIDSLALGAAWAAYRGVDLERLEGSNNWAVSGAKTATGKPLLANDPHRTIAVPALRYLTHLVGPGWNVIGAGEPGVPGVAAGHNERVAFGFTIVGMDQQDVYVEDVRPCDAAAARHYGATVGARCYLHRGETRPFQTIVDTVRVRGEPPRAVELRFTLHGPVVAEDTVRRRAFAVRFVGAEPGTAGYMASLSLDRAQDWADFRDAAARWKLPTENLVYADVDGNIGWVAAGLMPVRRWSGLLPVPGNGRFEWAGFVPAAELPATFNPPEGFIATANHNILPRGYARPLNYDWAERYRADRITDVLRRGSGFTRADFERLQHDELSLPARAMVPALLAAAKRRGVAGAEVSALARWDHVMRRDDAAPAVFAAWLSHLSRRVTARIAPAADSVTGGEVRVDLGVLVRQVARPDSLLGAAPAAARDSLVLLALDDATRELTRRLGADRARWSWGALHEASFAHPVAAAFDLPAAPRGGDGNTVNATGGAGFRQTSGASFREILDLADWDNSVATSTPGQSGQPESPHYGDLLPLWRDGRYFPLVYSRPRVEQETAHLLRLEPAP
jgi:penicillin amidase